MNNIATNLDLNLFRIQIQLSSNPIEFLKLNEIQTIKTLQILIHFQFLYLFISFLDGISPVKERLQGSPYISQFYMFMGGAQGLINILHTRRSPNRGCGSM